MRVQFKTEGGVAHFPGLSRPVMIDSTALSGEEAEELRRLLETARFFEQPPSPGVPPRGAADSRRYTVTVDADERQHTGQVAEPVADEALRELIRFLEAKARALRKPG